MDKFIVKGNKPVLGEIELSGAKNAALPIMTSTLLTDQPLILENIPYLSDIIHMNHLLLDLGVNVEVDGFYENNQNYHKQIRLQSDKINLRPFAHYDIVRKMRASIIVLGPLVARKGYAKVSLPGGCAIGARPIDLHLNALKQMNVDIKIEHGYVVAEAPNGLQGAHIIFPKISVGATENIMMAATIADGKTIIENAAREPEIIDLANCLNKMGAKIRHAGESTIEIEGVRKLEGVKHSVINDRIEAISFAAMAAITNGEIVFNNANVGIFHGVGNILEQAGIAIKETDDNKLSIKKANGYIEPVKIDTAPYPGFPTDGQAQLMSLVAIAKGRSIISEHIFENRFMHVPELNRMGADISIDGHTAIVQGVERLQSAEVMSTDLRASVSLIIAALNAQDESIINRVYHLDRGYDRLEYKLQKLGVDIRRIRNG